MSNAFWCVHRVFELRDILTRHHKTGSDTAASVCESGVCSTAPPIQLLYREKLRETLCKYPLIQQLRKSEEWAASQSDQQRHLLLLKEGGKADCCGLSFPVQPVQQRLQSKDHSLCYVGVCTWKHLSSVRGHKLRTQHKLLYLLWFAAERHKSRK